MINNSVAGNKAKTDLPVVLETGLFEDKDTLRTALQSLDLPADHWRTVNPEQMNDSDWDEVLTLVLSTNRVITL